MQTLAIIGSGISGLGAAWFLHREFDVTVFEAADYIGGHTCTSSPMPGSPITSSPATKPTG